MALPAYAPPDEFARRVNLATAAEVRAAMGRRRVNQTQLAKALDMSQPSLSRRLNGEVPFDAVDLARAAEALGVEVQDLIRSRCFATDPLLTSLPLTPEAQLELLDGIRGGWGDRPNLTLVET